jgi:hypothetical protein
LKHIQTNLIKCGQVQLTSRDATSALENFDWGEIAQSEVLKQVSQLRSVGLRMCQTQIPLKQKMARHPGNDQSILW